MAQIPLRYLDMTADLLVSILVWTELREIGKHLAERTNHL